MITNSKIIKYVGQSAGIRKTKTTMRSLHR